MTRARQQPTIAEPPDRLTGFPAFDVDPDRPLFRITRTGNGPWWFSSDGGGRFDLEPPRGTCYVALDPLSALIDVLGPDLCGGLVSEALVDARRLHALHVPRPHRLADLAHRGGVAFGATAELHTLTPYALPQRWAVAFAASAFDGVRYPLRHDPVAAPDGVALFGDAGEAPWPRGAESVVDEPLRARLRAECGVRVLPVPRASELSFAPDP